MSAASSVFSEEVSRKRMRKGTHSCTECRRRKKSCVMHPNGDKCTECIERGVDCQSQDARPLKHPRVESKQGLQERIVRLESTVQAIVGNLNTGGLTKETIDDSIHRLSSEADPSSPLSDDILRDAEDIGSAPILSMFDNAVLSRHDESGKRNGSASSPVPRRDHKIDKLRKTLLSHFPSPGLEAQISKDSYWWGPWHDVFPGIFGVDGSSTSIRDFVTSTKASGNVQQIAQALLCMIWTVQESKGFESYSHDHKATNTAWGSSKSECGRHIEKVIKLVDKLILADDELASSIEAVECMILLAKYDSNKGRIRSSWLRSRRGLLLGQLLGLHRRASGRTSEDSQRRETVWRALYQGDRFMSLMLGLPYGAQRGHCEMNRPSRDIPNYIFNMADLAGDVLDRNLKPSADGNYMDTVKIEGSMMESANSMSPEWWRPQLSEDEDEHLQIYRRLLPQFWYYQIRALLHLPFMLKANQDRRYEYNRVAALESAREMILRYQVLRPTQGFESLVCKLTDFQVFTAAMLLILNLYGSLAATSKRNEEEDERDWDLINSTHEILQQASKATDGVVASQAARALGMFVQGRNTECPYNKQERACKVVIPCFGTVSFRAGKDFARQPLCAQTPSTLSQSAGLPTPADSYSGTLDETQSSTSDPFISFDSYLAQMPFDFNLDGQAVHQPPGNFNSYSDSLANVNLDLDQDWAWYPAEQQAAPPLS